MLLEGFLVFCFGAIVGSFLNVIILRLPKCEPISGRSCCLSCGHTLAARDLFPFFSYLILKGRCRHCSEKISWRYPLIEFISALLFGFSYFYLTPSGLMGYLELIVAWLVVSVLLVVFVVDYEHYLILDKVVFSGSAAIAVLYLVMDYQNQMLGSFDSRLISGIVAATTLTLPFFLIWFLSKGRALGFGDVKLAIFLGLALRWPAVLAGLMVAILLGGVVSVWLLATTANTLKSKVPFGTFLSVGALIAFFFGQNLIEWYLAVLGL